MSQLASTPGFPWRLRGVVVHGHGRGGTKLGYPTANVRLDEATIQALSSYNNLVLFGYGSIERLEGDAASHVESPEEVRKHYGPFPFAMSVGYNPQFKDVTLSAEVHFLQSFSEDFYDHVIRIVVVDKIRKMTAFKSIDELIQTINGDVATTHKRMEEAAVKAFESDPFIQPQLSLAVEHTASLPYFSAG